MSLTREDSSLSKKESEKELRRMELETYSLVVSTMRAQGELNPEKKAFLKELAESLNISEERHKAEIRRAVNDEDLSIIANKVNKGAETAEAWATEGRRIIPIMPRLLAPTPFTALASHISNQTAEVNPQNKTPVYSEDEPGPSHNNVIHINDKDFMTSSSSEVVSPMNSQPPIQGPAIPTYHSSNESYLNGIIQRLKEQQSKGPFVIPRKVSVKAIRQSGPKKTNPPLSINRRQTRPTFISPPTWPNINEPRSYKLTGQMGRQQNIQLANVETRLDCSQADQNLMEPLDLTIGNRSRY